MPTGRLYPKYTWLNFNEPEGGALWLILRKSYLYSCKHYSVYIVCTLIPVATLQGRIQRAALENIVWDFFWFGVSDKLYPGTHLHVLD